MKTIIFSLGACLLLLSACNNKPQTMNDRAVDRARMYLRGQLGSDSANYTEGKWGTVEPRRIDWRNSNRYRLYQDTMTMMQDHLRMMNDSLDAEMQLNGAESPAYKTMQLRRDGYQMQMNTYQQNEAELNRMYDSQPEYNGYWLYHEYTLDGQPHRARIGIDDTTNMNATDVIYE
jgi:uncharacterized lipoprotein NlpE involved in copper resistance